MPRIVLAFGAVVVVSVLALLLVGGLSESRQVQSLGVSVAVPVAELGRGQQVCESPVGLVGDVDAVRFFPGTPAPRSPAMTVTLRSADQRRVLGRGTLRPGFDPALRQTVRVGRVSGGQLVALCFRNEGPAAVSVFGDQLAGPAFCTPSGRQSGVSCAPAGVRPTLTTAVAAIDGGDPLPGDVAAILLGDEPRSLLTRVPAMMERASLFRPGFVGPAVWWLFLAGWLVLLPAAAAYALRAAARPSSTDSEHGGRAAGGAAT